MGGGGAADIAAIRREERVRRRLRRRRRRRRPGCGGRGRRRRGHALRERRERCGVCLGVQRRGDRRRQVARTLRRGGRRRRRRRGETRLHRREGARRARRAEQRAERGGRLARGVALRRGGVQALVLDRREEPGDARRAVSDAVRVPRGRPGVSSPSLSDAAASSKPSTPPELRRAARGRATCAVCADAPDAPLPARARAEAPALALAPVLVAAAAAAARGEAAADGLELPDAQVRVRVWVGDERLARALHRRQPTVGVRRVVKPLGAIFRGSTQRADDGVQLLDLAVRPARDAVLAAPLLQNRHAQPELRRRVFVFSVRDVRVVGQFRFRRVGGKRNKKKKKGLKPREGNLGGGNCQPSTARFDG